jgi:hypothetical protein
MKNNCGNSIIDTECQVTEVNFRPHEIKDLKPEFLVIMHGFSAK